MCPAGLAPENGRSIRGCGFQATPPSLDPAHGSTEVVGEMCEGPFRMCL